MFKFFLIVLFTFSLYDLPFMFLLYIFFYLQLRPLYLSRIQIAFITHSAYYNDITTYIFSFSNLLTNFT